jgi:hypothetical protein
VIAACKPGFADCNGDPEDGCEAELAKDALNCDGCGNACPSTNGKPSCVEKTCQIACTAGFSDCDDLVGNGCEIDTQSNVLNCGACGKACPAVGGEPNCVKGVCGVSTCASGRADCDADKFLNGCEIDINNDPKNCGGCGLACVVENGTPGCVGGVCTVTKCDAGWADCNKDYSDGCEARLDTVTNCGACGAACDLPNAAETCASGTCGVQLCLGSYRDCDGEAANGCETNTADDASNCGICDNVCSDRNGEPVCRSGICGIVCDPSYGNCNQDAGDGCETSLSTSTKHCGVCGNACTAAHGTAMCLAGTCAVSDCDLNFADCDRAYVSGCESDTTQDLKNCGGCGRACSTNHGTPNCAAGACQITCATGYGDCSGGALDGCETDLRTNTRHCGACGNACSFANATASCVTSSCALGTCSTGYGNCDANDVNGCETNTLTAPLHCGGCGKKCNLANANAGCSGGSCTIASCKGSFQDCNGLTADGCESNLAVDELNCGSCGSVCEILHGTPNCVNGGCEVGTCDEGWEDCNGDPADGCETNVTSSVSNCGTCGNICPSATGTPNCVSGVCGVSSCSAGLGNCDGVGGCEANLKTDANNCGACGKVCAVTNGTGVCSNGTCAVDACAPGFDDCDGVYSNGCERSLTTLTDCGGCDVACALSNAAESCATGSCRIASCAAGFADCDSSPGNGCEVNTKTNTSHCGGCGAACSSTNGTASCSNGACGITCSAGYGNCNGSVSDGCEARLNTTTNCGSCGNTCSAANGAPSCTGTPLSCGIASCNTGYGNCDALTGNGCETDLRSNSAHCGGCGQACSSTNGSASCSNGSCSISCSSGYGNCDGSAGNGCEVSLLSDPDHCNSCSIACAYPNASAVCTSGKCGLGACQGSSRDCNGVATDGCERDVATDVTNCGSCGSSCTNANGGATCSSGNCSFSCNSGYKACDANPTNGCETDVRTITNCGTCGNACSYSNATAKCNAGTSCAIDSCDYLWGNCDNSSGNGCEKSLSGDAVNCGACGRTCSANHGSASCSGGACSITCDSGYGNCNGDAQKDGCEVNLASNKSHCGACNAVCSTECRGGACCVNLGAQNTPTTVRADRCLIVYPIQGATVRVQVHSLTAGPIPFTWTNGCGQSGSGTFSASWSSEPFPLCSPVVVDLAGPATDTGFQWWFEG